MSARCSGDVVSDEKLDPGASKTASPLTGHPKNQTNNPLGSPNYLEGGHDTDNDDGPAHGPAGSTQMVQAPMHRPPST